MSVEARLEDHSAGVSRPWSSALATIAWTALVSLIGPVAVLLGPAPPAGGAAPTPGDLPAGAPIIGLILLGAGFGAGRLAERARLQGMAGWTATILGGVVGLGLGRLAGAYLIPFLYSVTRVGYIAAVTPLLLIEFGVISVGYWLARLIAIRQRNVVRVPTPPIDARRALLPIALALVASVGVPTLASLSPILELRGDYPVLRIAISPAGITLDPASIAAGRVNLVITASGDPMCPVGGAPDGQEWLFIGTGTTSPYTPTSAAPAPPDAVAFRPAAVTDTGPVALAAGPLTWWCGPLQASMTVR